MGQYRLVAVTIGALLLLLPGCDEALVPTGSSPSSSVPVGPSPSPKPSISPAAQNPITTLAGGTEGNLDGQGEAARFRWPFGIAVAGDQTIYVADRLNHRIRRMNPAGSVSSLAGSESGTEGYVDGAGAEARFSDPQGVAVDAAGSVFVADSNNHRIRKVKTDGSVETMAGSTMGASDGTGASAQFRYPAGIAFDGQGNLLVADRDNHRIRRVAPEGQVETLTGGDPGYVDGPRTAARFNHPQGIAVGQDGLIFVADSNNHSIRKVTPSGEVTTLAGNGKAGFADGSGSSALFRHPIGLVSDGEGYLYVADWGNHCIRKIQISTGAVTTFAGSTASGYRDGALSAALFNMPAGVALSSSGSLFVADYGNHRIRQITP